VVNCSWWFNLFSQWFESTGYFCHF